jgi:cytochrome c nitrite reductase small subunit
MKSLFRFLLPPPRWRVPVLFLLGVATGLLCLVVYISNAVSYLSDKPETCMNCHVMAPEYATWQRGSHGRVATCNDCHVPHDNIVHKYAFKAQDGMRHASMFTFRLEPQVIRIKDAGENAVQENCKRCHEHLICSVAVTNPDMAPGGGIEEEDEEGEDDESSESPRCWHCHREVPHGLVRSLASTPYARVPIPSRVLPAWIEKQP